MNAYASLMFLALVTASPSFAAELQSFDDAATKFKAADACPSSKITPPSFSGDGRLFGCIDGPAQTAKYFINENGSSGRVKNIKVMWNDWYKDIGDGVHADIEQAEKMFSVAADLYFPDKKADILKAVRSDKTWSATAAGITLNYRYTRGPAIAERLLTITPAP